MDDTWKLSKGRSRSTTTSRSSTSKNHNKQQQQQQQYDQQEPHLLKSYSQRPSTSNRSPPYLPKSLSQRSSSKSRSSAKQASSSSTSRYGYADSSDLMMGIESEKGSSSSSSIGKKCGSLAREQKARFYIIRRCVAMLVCWHKHVDDS